MIEYKYVSTLVCQLVERVEMLDDKITVIFKSGLEIDVEYISILTDGKFFSKGLEFAELYTVIFIHECA